MKLLEVCERITLLTFLDRDIQRPPRLSNSMVAAPAFRKAAFLLFNILGYALILRLSELTLLKVLCCMLPLLLSLVFLELLISSFSLSSKPFDERSH